MNSTTGIDDTPVSELPTVYKTYSAADFVIGLFICLGAAVANAAGVNLIKRDFLANEQIPKAQRRRDWLRPLWLAGMALYIASQLIGSTLALEYLRAEYVAPLGSTSLVFNFVFAKLFVGTSITRMDIAGTLVIILGVCGVVGFGNLRVAAKDDVESNLNLQVIKHLWSRSIWIIYFIALESLSVLSFYIASIIDQVWLEKQELESRSDGEGRYTRTPLRSEETFLQKIGRRRRLIRMRIKKAIEAWSVSRPDIALRKVSGLAWAVSGGLLAGQTLVFAKSAVKLISTAVSGESTENQLASPLSIFIIILLVIAAVVQIYCLNKGLQVYDSTLIIPLFFATYTASGFLNSLIYMDQYGDFKTWVFVMVWLSILLLVIGVAILSTKKAETPGSKAEFDADEEEGLEQQKDAEQYQLPELSKIGRKGRGRAFSRETAGRKGSDEYEQIDHQAEDEVWKNRDSTDSEGSCDVSEPPSDFSRPRLHSSRDDEFGSFVGIQAGASSPPHHGDDRYA